ncbi:MAG TPA: type II toxin-antitoxin system VapC family toxin [Longimicrobium sp.]
MLFLDASAVAKLYLDEYGSGVVRGAVKRAKGALFLSDYVALEVLTALRVGFRSASRDKYQEKLDGFWADFPRKYNVVEVSPAIRKAAMRLTTRVRHARARSLDVLHLATALEVQATFVGVQVTMVTSDQDLAALAVTCGLRTFDPSREPLAALPRAPR